jgi:cytochrome c oxidase subunit 1
VRAASDTNVAREGQHIHMPSPSYFPIVAAFGLLIIAYGMIMGRTNGANYLVSVAGVLVLLTGLYGWALEPSAAPDEVTHDQGHEPPPALVGAPGPAGSLAAGPAGSLEAGPTAGSNGGPGGDAGDGPPEGGQSPTGGGA